MTFCKMCGSPLESANGQPERVNCVSCGGMTPSGYRFCQQCGTPLENASASTSAEVSSAPAPAPAISKTQSKSGQPLAAKPSATLGASKPAPSGVGAEAPKGAPPLVARPDAPIVVEPLKSPTGPPLAATVVPGAQPAVGDGDMAKTIIEMDLPPGGFKPPTDFKVDAGALASAEAAPAPSAAKAPPMVTPPAGMPVNKPMTSGGARSQPTLGPGGAAPQAQPEREPMARLVAVNRDGTDGETFIINEESFDLGRIQGQLTFEDDPYLSDRHCRFFTQNDRWMLQDLQSCNGVYLQLNAPFELEHGDRVLLGKQVFVFEWLSEHERGLAPAVEHGVLIFGSPIRTPWARLRQITVAGVYRDVYYLYRPKMVLGREEGDLLFPDDEFMSRQHLSLVLEESRALIQDLGSSNGTFVQVRQQHALSVRDMLRVGDQLLRFEEG